MGLIDQKGVALLMLLEEPAKIDTGIESIVVITDHYICPECHIEREFKGTDPVFTRQPDNPLPGKDILLQTIFDCLRDSIIITFSIFTLIGVTGGIRFETDLILRCQSDRNGVQALLGKQIHATLGYILANRFGCQIENLIAEVIAQRFHGREDNRYCFTDTGSCLEEKPLVPLDALIDLNSKFSLAETILLKGKGHRRSRDITDSLAILNKPGKIEIASDQFFELLLCLLQRQGLTILFHLIVIDIIIGKLYLDRW